MTIKESHEGYKDPFVITSTGRKFYLQRPEFVLEDLVHSLCNNIRYNGHCLFPYTVGQHSLMVAEITGRLITEAKPEAPVEELRMAVLEGLLHDGTEAYLSDIPSPFKQLLPDWRAIDAKLDAQLRTHFKLPPTKNEFVKQADWYALFIEADALLPERGIDEFEDPMGFKPGAMLMKWDLISEVRPSDLERDKRMLYRALRKLMDPEMKEERTIAVH